ncbi:MAG: deoxyribose-phosphate aldolase [Erysipelotrichaceae bacterium]
MELNRYIDHTLLKADATEEEIKQLCQQAKDYNFKAVCVNSCWIEYCLACLKGSDTSVCCVIGFPLGANLSEAKAAEARCAVAKGVNEIDMVINIAYLKDGKYEALVNDIKMVKEACGDIILKVIIETCLLNDSEKQLATKAVVDAGADFVKTSTGYSLGGATVGDVILMKAVTKGKIKIKAAGGVKTVSDLKAMIEAGADRIGTSRGVALMGGNNSDQEY